jgi:hypothetical protein
MLVLCELFFNASIALSVDSSKDLLCFLRKQIISGISSFISAILFSSSCVFSSLRKTSAPIIRHEKCPSLLFSLQQKLLISWWVKTSAN